MKSFAYKPLIVLTCLTWFAACTHTVPTTGPKPEVFAPTKRVPGSAMVPGTQRPYIIDGKRYYPLPTSQGYVEKGVASWYGGKFHGRKTASGEIYNMHAKTAAHKTLPINTLLLVKNLENQKETVVRVNDRGPFVKGRIIDLSLTSAKELDIVKKGTARVQIVALGEAVSYRQANETINRFLPHNDFETGEFYIQIGSFTNPLNAGKLKNKMLGWGKKATVRLYNDGTATYYRVHVRAGTSLSTAKRMTRVLGKAGYPGFVVAQ